MISPNFQLSQKKKKKKCQDTVLHTRLDFQRVITHIRHSLINSVQLQLLSGQWLQQYLYLKREPATCKLLISHATPQQYDIL